MEPEVTRQHIQGSWPIEHLLELGVLALQELSSNITKAINPQHGKRAIQFIHAGRYHNRDDFKVESLPQPVCIDPITPRTNYVLERGHLFVEIYEVRVACYLVAYRFGGAGREALGTAVITFAKTVPHLKKKKQ